MTPSAHEHHRCTPTSRFVSKPELTSLTSCHLLLFRELETCYKQQAVTIRSSSFCNSRIECLSSHIGIIRWIRGSREGRRYHHVICGAVSKSRVSWNCRLKGTPPAVPGADRAATALPRPRCGPTGRRRRALGWTTARTGQTPPEARTRTSRSGLPESIIFDLALLTALNRTF